MTPPPMAQVLRSTFFSVMSNLINYRDYVI
jgi:hypothetical protein